MRIFFLTSRFTDLIKELNYVTPETTVNGLLHTLETQFRIKKEHAAVWTPKGDRIRPSNSPLHSFDLSPLAVNHVQLIVVDTESLERPVERPPPKLPAIQAPDATLSQADAKDTPEVKRLRETVNNGRKHVRGAISYSIFLGAALALSKEMVAEIELGYALITVQQQPGKRELNTRAVQDYQRIQKHHVDLGTHLADLAKKLPDRLKHLGTVELHPALTQRMDPAIYGSRPTLLTTVDPDTTFKTLESCQEACRALQERLDRPLSELAEINKAIFEPYNLQEQAKTLLARLQPLHDAVQSALESWQKDQQKVEDALKAKYTNDLSALTLLVKKQEDSFKAFMSYERIVTEITASLASLCNKAVADTLRRVRLLKKEDDLWNVSLEPILQEIYSINDKARFVRLVLNLPDVYRYYLVEIVRRREWTQAMNSNSAVATCDALTKEAEREQGIRQEWNQKYYHRLTALLRLKMPEKFQVFSVKQFYSEDTLPAIERGHLDAGSQARLAKDQQALMTSLSLSFGLGSLLPADNGRIADLQKSLTDSEQKVKQLEDSDAANRRKLEEERRKLEDERRKVEEERTKNQELSASLGKASEAVTIEKAKIQRLEAENAELVISNQQYSASYMALESAMEASSTDDARKVTEAHLEKRVAGLEEAKEALLRDRERLEKELFARRANEAQLQSRVARMEAELAAAKAEKAKAEKQLAELAAEKKKSDDLGVALAAQLSSRPKKDGRAKAVLSGPKDHDLALFVKRDVRWAEMVTRSEHVRVVLDEEDTVGFSTVQTGSMFLVSIVAVVTDTMMSSQNRYGFPADTIVQHATGSIVPL